MRVLVAVMALFLTACTCTMAGCISALQVSMDRNHLELGTSYTIRACIDDDCTVVEREVRHDGDPYEFTLPLDGLDAGPEALVTLDIRDENGALVDEYTGNVSFSRHQPNGRWCEPTCWSGTIERP